MGQADSIVFDYARSKTCVLITYNCDDFQLLHEATTCHPGILAIYRDANPAKNMSFKAIVRAIANLEATNVPLENQFIALNQWNY